MTLALPSGLGTPARRQAGDLGYPGLPECLGVPGKCYSPTVVGSSQWGLWALAGTLGGSHLV